MKLAAIDIGSNAIRLQIVKVFEENDLVSFKKLEFLRFPLRLGHDVFKKGQVSLPVIDKFTRLMRTFKLLIDLYEVEAYSAVATSAMREAANGQELQAYIQNQVGLEIDIISGEAEARILHKAIVPYLQADRHYLHIDVGGGSTELNLFVGKEPQNSHSFRMGSVRKLSSSERNDLFKQMKKWIADSALPASSIPIGIGTGGNINKLYKLSNKNRNQSISVAELKGLRAYVKAFSNQERMSLLKMNPDRADVIVPASEIYLRALQYAGCDEILVPKVGLKDGLVYELFERVVGKNLAQIEFLQEF
jgi:exopolyphosphatase/guanosine-5'-triphosphate,3'-diphosphate pyrophosphatase